MDDSPVQETIKVSNNNLDDKEIDPLDAYMFEIDQQVQSLDEKDKLKIEEEQVKVKVEVKVILDSTKPEIEGEDEDDEEETIGKAGNFSTVEELIA